MVDYKKSFKRPFTDFKKTSLGALLFVIPSLILLLMPKNVYSNSLAGGLLGLLSLIMTLLIYGYFLNCIKDPKKKLPEWKNWKNLLLRGLFFMVISALYILPFLAVMVMILNAELGLRTVSLDIITFIYQNPVIAVKAVASAVKEQSLAMGLLRLLAAYIVPMAIVNYAQKFEFKQAFGFKKILSKLLTRKYALAWVAMMGYYLAWNYSIFLLVKIAPWIVIEILLSYSVMVVGITAFTTYSQAYKEIK